MLERGRPQSIVQVGEQLVLDIGKLQELKGILSGNVHGLPTYR